MHWLTVCLSQRCYQPAIDRTVKTENRKCFAFWSRTKGVWDPFQPLFLTVRPVAFYTYLSSSLPDSPATLSDQTKFIRVMNILLVPVFRACLVFSLSFNNLPLQPTAHNLVQNIYSKAKSSLLQNYDLTSGCKPSWEGSWISKMQIILTNIRKELCCPALWMGRFTSW